MQPYLRQQWTNLSNLVCEGFSSCSTEILSWKGWNAKTKIWWRHTKVFYTQCEFIHSYTWAGNVAVTKLHQQPDEIFILPAHPGKQQTYVQENSCHGICCMKPMHAFVTSTCWLHRIASSLVGVLQEFLANNFADILDEVWVKNQGFVQPFRCFITATIGHHDLGHLLETQLLETDV